jgi:hypothetical protein
MMPPGAARAAETALSAASGAGLLAVVLAVSTLFPAMKLFRRRCHCQLVAVGKLTRTTGARAGIGGN